MNDKPVLLVILALITAIIIMYSIFMMANKILHKNSQLFKNKKNLSNQVKTETHNNQVVLIKNKRGLTTVLAKSCNRYVPITVIKHILLFPFEDLDVCPRSKWDFSVMHTEARYVTVLLHLF